MESQAYFSGIREQIIQHLNLAKDRVLVAVAWLTDRALFDALVACQRRKVQVSLAVLDDRINRKSSIAWERLTALGGDLYWIPDGTNRAGSLHHKFCLIDEDTVINGSFNWTNRASNADENIVIIQGDAEFAEQFKQAFGRLLDKHGHELPPAEIDKTKLLRRLEVIGQLLELEDFEDIPAQASKLENANNLPEIAEIIALLHGEKWGDAKAKIIEVRVRGLAIALYEDPRVVEWRWQARMMEAQVLTMEAELADMLRRIHLFDHQQEQAIGDLIREYLDVKRRLSHARYKKSGGKTERDDAKAADETYEEYEQARAEIAREPAPHHLNPEEQMDLKTLYRKLAKRCHPDHAEEADKAWATEMFKELNAANRNNDLDAMRRLQSQIEGGSRAVTQAEMPSRADALQALIAKLQSTIDQLMRETAAIVRSATWQALSREADWSAWFERKAAQIQEEIVSLQSQLNELSI